MRSRLLVALVSFAACSPSPPRGETYYEHAIQPLLNASCVGGVAPCHRDDGNGVALGNLDLSSFEAVQQRRDVLVRHGAYPEPLLLIKAVSSRDLLVPYRGQFYPLEIAHGGGPILDPSSDAYYTLQQWLKNGATENGLPAVDPGSPGEGPCSETVPDTVDPATVSDSDPGWAGFEPVDQYLVSACGAGSCHGMPTADFALTCGNTDTQRRANYLMARAFVADPPDDSELLSRPLEPTGGGQYHSGGVFFSDRQNADYVTVRDWAAQAGPLEVADKSPARTYFEDRVMPILLQRGCASTACHSPIVPHKLHLRAGSDGGFFSTIALDRNYAEVHKGFIALESPDPRASRLVAKNMLSIHRGITHRAGAVLETPGASADPADCDAPPGPDAPPLCVIKEWLRLERAAQPPEYIGDLSEGAMVPLIYVERPPDAVRFVDRTSYRPGADLLRADATMGSGASIASASGRVSLLDGCPGVGADRADVDVRAPEISFDGERVIFAMRVGVSAGLDLYEVGIDGSNCHRVTTDGGTVADGIAVHNFDPLYVIDGDGVEWVVYASTRRRSRSPVYMVPGTDLWRQPLAGGPAEEMTFLRAIEAQPALMGNGQLTMTQEKASSDFYQICGRRLNWDLTDYHPLLANRLQNYQGRGGYLPGQVPADAIMRPSIGYQQATEIRQALDGNFLVVLADRDTYGGGGALGLFNRSVGPFEQGRSDPSFVRSLSLLPGPSGRAGDASGAYRSPFPLPDGSVLASYAAGADVGSAAPIDYDVVVVDRHTGERRPLIGGAGSQVEAVLAYPRPPPHVLTLPATGSRGATPDSALVHFPDLPLLATILDSNNRRGRAVDSLRAAVRVRFFAEDPPPLTCDSPANPACAPSMSGSEGVYESRRELGSVPIESDGSVYARVPARQPLFFELVDRDDNVMFRLREEFEFGPSEVIGIGVPEHSFNSMCAGCHGSVSGRELDIAVRPDAVTTASATVARSHEPRTLE